MRLLLPLLLFAVLTVCVAAQEPVPQSGNTVPGSLLENTIPDSQLDAPFACDFNAEIPLGEALQHVHKTTTIELFIDHPALREADITMKTPVKFRLPFLLPLRDVLDYLAKQTGTAWTVKEGMITITSPEKAKGEWLSKAYYVGDLLGVPLATVPVVPIAGSPEAERLRERFTGIIDYIQTMVAPESWENGAISEYYPNLSLVVRQREEQHEEIAGLLQRIRKFKEIQVMFDAEAPVQIGYIVETAPFDSPPKDEHGVVQWTRLECRSSNGQSVKPNLGSDKKLLVRVQADSATPVAPELAKQNDPLYFIMPAGKQLELQGVASSDKQSIRVQASFEGFEPQTRTFHAKAFEGTTKR